MFDMSKWLISVRFSDLSTKQICRATGVRIADGGALSSGSRDFWNGENERHFKIPQSTMLHMNCVDELNVVIIPDHDSHHPYHNHASRGVLLV